MFLVRLRRGLFEQDTTDRFNINFKTVSRNMVGELPVFHLGKNWLSKETIQPFLPPYFQTSTLILG